LHVRDALIPQKELSIKDNIFLIITVQTYFGQNLGQKYCTIIRNLYYLVSKLCSFFMGVRHVYMSHTKFKWRVFSACSISSCCKPLAFGQKSGKVPNNRPKLNVWWILAAEYSVSAERKNSCFGRTLDVMSSILTHVARPPQIFPCPLAVAASVRASRCSEDPRGWEAAAGWPVGSRVPSPRKEEPQSGQLKERKLRAGMQYIGVKQGGLALSISDHMCQRGGGGSPIYWRKGKGRGPFFRLMINIFWGK
jgi:hypothetical protein